MILERLGKPAPWRRLPLALELRETLTGSYRATGSRDRPMLVELRARTRLAELLARRELSIDGTVQAEGLAEPSNLEGSVLIEPTRLVYRFAFRALGERALTFVGERRRPTENLLEDVSLLSATLLDERGEVFGKALLRFDLQRHFGALVRSLRVVW